MDKTYLRGRKTIKGSELFESISLNTNFEKNLKQVIIISLNIYLTKKDKL